MMHSKSNSLIGLIQGQILECRGMDYIAVSCLLFSVNSLSLSSSFGSNGVLMSTDNYPCTIFQLNRAGDRIDNFV